MPQTEKIGEFLAKIQIIQSLMVQVSTYKSPIKEKESEYVKLYRELDTLFKEFNIANPNPFPTLTDFYGYWSMKFKTWAERRSYISGLYDDVEAELNAIPTAPVEEIAASGLMKLGYKMLESRVSVPSGESIDFVMERDGKKVGVEVKSRPVATLDLERALHTKSLRGLDHLIMISVEGFGVGTVKFANKHGILLKTLNNLVEDVDRSHQSTIELKRGITNYKGFIRHRPTPRIEHFRIFKELFGACLSAKSNEEKKTTLQNLGRMLIELIEGLKVVGENVNMETEEIDLIVKNESTDPFWQKLQTPFLVECKNWSKPIGAKEIRDFDGKMKDIRFRILISINGITGQTERDDARGVIRDARKEGRIIVVLDKGDLEDIAHGTNPAEKINAKYYELYMSYH